MRIAATTQLRDALKKIIPDYKEQQALTYLRDYKGSPQGLQEAIDRYEVGDNEQQKALNESRRMAQNPSPALLEADAATHWTTTQKALWTRSSNSASWNRASTHRQLLAAHPHADT